MTGSLPSSTTADAPAEPGVPTTTLHPAARVLWRSSHEAQLEIGTRRIVVDGVNSDIMRHLLGMRPAPPGTNFGISALQHRLVAAGYLWADRATGQTEHEPDLRRTPPQPRLSSELTALAARTGEAAAELLNARGHLTVAIQGTGRAGPHLADILAAAGIGRVHVADNAPARLHHAVPGGLLTSDEGVPLAAASAAAMLRHAPEVDTVPPPFGERPDLVILAIDEPVDAERRNALHARGCAHLLVRLAPDHGSVGPLVLPGLTSCLQCADLHRLDRDPAWNALAVQLTVPHRATVASEVALATAIAGVAGLQALDFLDGGTPATIEGSLEMHLPDWRVRRRSWPIHPDCTCVEQPD